MHIIPVVELLRQEEDFDYGTFGVLKINKKMFCWTLEPPDNLNVKNISSIPEQQYICERYVSRTYGETFTVTNVPGRSYVLIHPGNIAKDTRGCIILGQIIGTLKNKRAVLNSGATFRAFMNIMRGVDSFHLTIGKRY
jgi:hypothetical protein